MLTAGTVSVRSTGGSVTVPHTIDEGNGNVRLRASGNLTLDAEVVNISNGSVLALQQNPDQFAKLKADHALIPSMICEVIRWQTPLAHMRRVATEDVELGGKTIRDDWS